MKLEPAFLGENEEASLAAGYVRCVRQRTQSGYRPGRGKTFDSSRTQGFRQPSVSNQKQGPKKDINPTESDGRLLK